VKEMWSRISTTVHFKVLWFRHDAL